MANNDCSFGEYAFESNLDDFEGFVGFVIKAGTPLVTYAPGNGEDEMRPARGTYSCSEDLVLPQSSFNGFAKCSAADINSTAAAKCSCTDISCAAALMVFDHPSIYAFTVDKSDVGTMWQCEGEPITVPAGKIDFIMSAPDDCDAKLEQEAA